MNCPACGKSMKEIQIQDIAVDACVGGCGGIWFDWFELKKVDEPHEALGEDLIHVERDESIVVDRQLQRECPRCDGQKMLQHFASVKREVAVDECPACGGYFLDYGELNQIRDQFGTEEERRQAAEALFADLFDEGLSEIGEESEIRTERARGLARMFRFLLPSHYMPGKQKWGAF